MSVPAPSLGTTGLNTGQGESSVKGICVWLRSVLSKDVVLVIDDLHRLQPESDAASVVGGLCQQAPDRLHLVLVSRHELPFSLQRLRGRGLVTEIHAPDFAFDVADVETLLRKTVGTYPPGLSRRVWEHTGGWATALHCAVEMLRAVEPDQRLAAVGNPLGRGTNDLLRQIAMESLSRVRQLFSRCCAGWRSSARSDPRRRLGEGTMIRRQCSPN